MLLILNEYMPRIKQFNNYYFIGFSKSKTILFPFHYFIDGYNSTASSQDGAVKAFKNPIGHHCWM